MRLAEYAIQAPKGPAVPGSAEPAETEPAPSRLESRLRDIEARLSRLEARSPDKLRQ